MEKTEFDRLSEKMGYGPCAHDMWPEIELFYSAHDNITKELAAFVYWNEPNAYREILALRRAIEKKLETMFRAHAGKPEVEGYDYLTCICWLDSIEREKSLLLGAVNEAKEKFEAFKKSGGWKRRVK